MKPLHEKSELFLNITSEFDQVYQTRSVAFVICE